MICDDDVRMTSLPVVEAAGTCSSNCSSHCIELDLAFTCGQQQVTSLPDGL